VSVSPIGETRRSAAVRPPVLKSPLPIVAAALGSGVLVAIALTLDIQLGVALLAGVLCLPLALLNLPLAVVLWMPLAYLESWPTARFVPLGVALIIGLAWLGTLGAGSLASEVVRRHRGTFLLLALFLAWLTVSLAWSTEPVEGAEEIWRWFVSAAVFMVIATTLSTSRQLIAVCIAIAAVGLFALVIAVPELSPEGAQTDEAARLGGSLENPNFLAAELLIAMLLAVGLIAVIRPVRWRWVLAGAGAVLAFGVLLTGSRGGLIATVTAAAAALVLVRGRRLQLVALLAGVGVVGVMLAPSSLGSLDRLREFDAGGTGRVDLWTVAWEMAKDNPVQGVGLDNFQVEAPEKLLEVGALQRADLIAETPKLVHNAYLTFLAETGIVGLSLFLLLVWTLLRATWSGARSLDKLGDKDLAALAGAILVAQVGALVALVFLSNPGNNPLWALFALGPVILTIAEHRGRGTTLG